MCITTIIKRRGRLFSKIHIATLSLSILQIFPSIGDETKCELRSDELVVKRMVLTVVKEVGGVDLEAAHVDIEGGARVRDQVRFGDLDDDLVGEGENIL